MKISFEIKGIPEALETYNHATVRKALGYTLGQLGKKVSGRSKKSIREDYNIKLKDMKGMIKTLPMRGGVLSVIIRATGGKIPLINFIAKQKAAGVSVKVKRQSAGTVIPHTFIAEMRSGHIGIFERTIEGGKRVPRLPIKELKGPSIPTLFVSRKVMSKINQTVNEFAQKLFNTNLRYFVEKKGGTFKGIPGIEESEE